MKYKTSDLSKLLNVSANTIRRFAQKGYLQPDRDDENQYRYFDNADVEKITYISKYRKIGFGHEEIAGLLQSDIFDNCITYQHKMDEIDNEIKRLNALRHMLKDDINMMKVIDTSKDDFIEMNSVAVYFFSYKTDGRIRNSKDENQIAQRFLYEFPEIEYVYIIRREDIIARRVRLEEAIAVRAELARKRNLDVNSELIETYPKRQSVLKVVKLPIDFMNEDIVSRKDVRKLLFDDFFDYMKVNGYVLAGDAFGVKVGFSRENGKDMQYIILGMPVEKVK